MSSTKENLWAAFAGESQANRKYLAYAKKAEAEGYSQVARLFRAAASAETVHAHAHLRVLGQVKSTVENLKDAIAGETHEFKEMYPEMIATAQSEGETSAERSFKFANKVERVHAELYQKAMENLENLKEVDYYVCEVCGYTCESEAPENCPVCGVKKDKFFKAD
jgi:rubrerythrin